MFWSRSRELRALLAESNAKLAESNAKLAESNALLAAEHARLVDSALKLAAEEKRSWDLAERLAPLLAEQLHATFPQTSRPAISDRTAESSTGSPRYEQAEQP
jgi:hypothetical protein